VDQSGLRPQRYSARYGARDPWLAGGWRAGLYLVWRFAFALWRPLIFVALLAASLAFSLRAAAEMDLRPPPPTQEAQLADAVAVVVGDPQAWWASALESALSPATGSGPDLVLAAALAPALPDLAGRDQLARRVLMEQGASARRVDAMLRAEPRWRRDRRLAAALDTRLAYGRDTGLSPPELVFAPRSTAHRLARASRLYGPSIEVAERWFSDPGGRALVLRGVPGLESAPEGAALHGDVRDLLIQACALAERAGRRVGQCRVAFLPKPDADLLVAGFALVAAGADGQALTAARILKAAAAAELMDPAFAGALVLGSDPDLAREAILSSAMPLISVAGERYTRPVYSGEDARIAADAFVRVTGVDLERRDRVFAHVAAIRRDAGALAAVRMAGLIRSEADAERLARIADQYGPKTLAIHHALGDAMLALAETTAPQPRRALSRQAKRAAGLAAAFVLLAIGLVVWVGVAGVRRNRGGAPGLVERVDTKVTRLILGRNS